MVVGIAGDCSETALSSYRACRPLLLARMRAAWCQPRMQLLAPRQRAPELHPDLASSERMKLGSNWRGCCLVACAPVGSGYIYGTSSHCLQLSHLITMLN